MLSSGLACAFWSFSINSFAMPRIKRKKQQKVQSDDLWIAVAPGLLAAFETGKKEHCSKLEMVSMKSLLELIA